MNFARLTVLETQTFYLYHSISSPDQNSAFFCSKVHIKITTCVNVIFIFYMCAALNHRQVIFSTSPIHPEKCCQETSILGTKE